VTHSEAWTASCQASCSRTLAGVSLWRLVWRRSCGAFRSFAGGESGVVQQRGRGLAEDVAVDPWHATPSEALAQVALGVGRVAEPTLSLEIS
jgi:hypothetical protein